MKIERWKKIKERDKRKQNIMDGWQSGKLSYRVDVQYTDHMKKWIKGGDIEKRKPLHKNKYFCCRRTVLVNHMQDVNWYGESLKEYKKDRRLS